MKHRWDKKSDSRVRDPPGAGNLTEIAPNMLTDNRKTCYTDRAKCNKQAQKEWHSPSHKPSEFSEGETLKGSRVIATASRSKLTDSQPN